MTLEEYIIFQRYDIKGYATSSEDDDKVEEPIPNSEKAKLS